MPEAVLLSKIADNLSKPEETEICLSPGEGEQIPNVYKYELIAEDLRLAGYPVMKEIRTLMGTVTAIKSRSEKGTVNYALRGRNRSVKTILSINQAY